jgi:hypothetical protein
MDVAIDEEYQGSDYVVTDPDGVGPFVGARVNINPFKGVHVETIA